MADRARPLVAALHAYEREHGRPPGALEELVPRYLVEVPTPAVEGHPRYLFRAFPEGGTRTVWWELEPDETRGADRPGQVSGAVLAAAVDDRGEPSRCWVERVPPAIVRRSFDPLAWRMGTDRLGMLADLAPQLDGERLGWAALGLLLGPPDGASRPDRPNWELSIECAAGGELDDGYGPWFFWPRNDPRWPPRGPDWPDQPDAGEQVGRELDQMGYTGWVRYGPGW